MTLAKSKVRVMRSTCPDISHAALAFASATAGGAAVVSHVLVDEPGIHPASLKLDNAPLGQCITSAPHAARRATTALAVDNGRVMAGYGAYAVRLPDFSIQQCSLQRTHHSFP